MTMKTQLTLVFIFVFSLQGNLLAREQNQPIDVKWQPIAGQHYHKITTDEPGGKSIKFYFWPGSKSCFQLDHALQNWLQQHPEITLQRIPLVKRPHWRLLAKAWLVALEMDDGIAFLNELYQKIHMQSDPINSFAELEQFIISRGINPLNFKAVFNSLTVNQQLQILQNQANQLPVSGVPAIIVNNQWYTDASTGITSSQLITIIDQLLSDTPDSDIAAKAEAQ